MNKHLSIPLIASLLLIAAGCSPTPSPIVYGSDMCHDCKMTIVDQQHAAQLVTTKGKVMKFDAIECMIHYAHDHPGEGYAYQLVADYEHPKALINASESHFLICKQIPSPMGAFLSAFQSEETAEKIRETKGGQIFDWNSLQIKFGAKSISHW